MNIDPLSIAVKEITDTKDILECLVTSSETFDYLKTKAALKDLTRKLRELGRMRARLEALQRSSPLNIHVLDFKAQVPPQTDSTS